MYVEQENKFHTWFSKNLNLVTTVYFFALYHVEETLLIFNACTADWLVVHPFLRLIVSKGQKGALNLYQLKALSCYKA